MLELKHLPRTIFKRLMKESAHQKEYGIREILKYVGPGLLVTVGFIDPGNWASNMAAGAEFGYSLLWMVTLATIMLILLQHNVAHLGIVTGDCLAEATMKYLPPWLARTILGSGILAVISTSMAEILGGAIALEMLFDIPIRVGAVFLLVLVLFLLFSNTYSKLEKLIVSFVSVIGFSFLYELSTVAIDWPEATQSWVTPSQPPGSMLVIMAVLGAVVMPHNLFLHSEVIQSRQWNLEDEAVIQRQLKYEFADTSISMIIGWAINSAMIILAAATFYQQKIQVTDLSQAQELLVPILGTKASLVFAIALLFSGVSSCITAGMAGGSIVAGLYKEPYDIKDPHSKLGVTVILVLATLVIFVVQDPFQGLVYSQMLLSIQLPITVFLQIYLTSSERIMGRHKNSFLDKSVLLILGVLISVLNLMLFQSLIKT